MAAPEMFFFFFLWGNRGSKMGFWGQGAINLPKIAGGGTRLPKLKFLAKFPIGLHMILQNTDKKKNQKCVTSYVQNYFEQNSVGVQPWTPLEIILDEFFFCFVFCFCFLKSYSITVRFMQRSRMWVLPNWIGLFLPPLENSWFLHFFHLTGQKWRGRASNGGEMSHAP